MVWKLTFQKRSSSLRNSMSQPGRGVSAIWGTGKTELTGLPSALRASGLIRARGGPSGSCGHRLAHDLEEHLLEVGLLQRQLVDGDVLSRSDASSRSSSR